MRIQGTMACKAATSFKNSPSKARLTGSLTEELPSPSVKKPCPGHDLVRAFQF